jgi:hypothetical protein
MRWLEQVAGYVLMLLPFAWAGAAAVVAAFGKAWSRFPVQPDETKRFRKYPVPRTYLLCFRYFDTHKLERPLGRKVRHENTDSQRPRRHRG